MAEQRSMAGVVGAVVALAVLAVGFWMVSRSPGSEQADGGAARELPYEAAVEGMALDRIAEDLGPVSRLAFEPDGRYLLAGRLTGEILVFARTDDGWVQADAPLATIETNLPGFPPEENGLTGLAFGADYRAGEGGDLFASYAYQASDKEIINRVARIDLVDDGTQLTAGEPTDIFEANAPTAPSHQIQEVVGVLVQDKPHVLFQLGEGFETDRATDPSQEAGKLMLIQRDGSNPLGPRPFKNQPKLQAIGLRNPPGLAVNPYDPLKRQAIVDTGPSQNDRFLYGTFIDLREGKAVTGLNFEWDGTEESLSQDVEDSNSPGTPNAVLYRWNPTRTATNIVFHPGKGVIPTSDETRTSVLVSLFGPTGESGDIPGREIWLGELRLDEDQPTLSFEPLIVRSESGIDAEGHPLGLIRDPQTDDLAFADILEGALYWLSLEEGTTE